VARDGDRRGLGRLLPQPQDYSAPVAYRPPAAWYRRFNWLGVLLTSIGWAPEGAVTLTVPGRRSGKLRRVPVLVTEHDGEEYLVALAGESQWVRNARAADNRVVLTRRSSRLVQLQELPVPQRSPILVEYIEAARRRHGEQAAADAAQYYFGVTKPDPETLDAVASRYPVFRIQTKARV
jgi:deazaflavin-dependent oxidoreductase (nitroreductase family)